MGYTCPNLKEKLFRIGRQMSKESDILPNYVTHIGILTISMFTLEAKTALYINLSFLLQFLFYYRNIKDNWKGRQMEVLQYLFITLTFPL